MNLAPLKSAAEARAKVDRLQEEVSKLPQYQPRVAHYFHGGIYCREVWRRAGILVVGRVHLKEHFYVIASGRVRITTDDGAEDITGPRVLLSKPGTKRAVLSITAAHCLTFHRTDALTPEEAEIELVEPDPTSLYLADGSLKTQEVIA